MESKINVSLRIKPLTEAERLKNQNMLWQALGDTTVINQRTKEMFSFDNVFSDRATTTELFEKAVKENVKTAVDGFNVTVFAYG